MAWRDPVFSIRVQAVRLAGGDYNKEEEEEYLDCDVLREVDEEGE
jgi:hypothetical protein